MEKLSSLLEHVSTVAILGHVRPDGDCVGSCLATWNYINTWFPGVQAQVYLEPVPNIFRFLQGADQICNDQDADICYDLCIVQDCSDTLRPGAFIKYFKTAKKTVCIDHHISNGSFADVNHVFPDVSSTSELIFTLLEEEKITKEIAECIYTGIVHDTGVFQYSSTSARTMNIAGKLMEKGIDFTRIIDETFYTKTYNQNRILGKALMDSKLYLDGACIASYVTMADMEGFEVLPKHLDGIVSQLRVTKDVELAVFLYELEPGRFKLSMRSNGKVNVADIAVTFGGGGHVRAAGADMEGTAEKIIGKICAEAKKQLC